jgi:thymidine kinase
MAKLYFYYSAMNAGKSTVLLQSSYNYHERGMETLLFTPRLDTRAGDGKIASRIGLDAAAIPFDKEFNLYEYTKSILSNRPLIKCVFVDEAQFMTKEQVEQLTNVVDELNLPVLAYGLRSDFRGEPYPGSKYLLALADNLVEIKTICHCGRKATMNMRIDEHGDKITEGAQVQIGGNESYMSVCRLHYKNTRASALK